MGQKYYEWQSSLQWHRCHACADVTSFRSVVCMMPKRKNPFGEYTPLQCKTHVGFEQMATEEERQAVFGEP